MHIVTKFISFLEKFPPTFVVGYSLYARLPFLLPHDKSYLIFPYFMTAREGTILDIGANVGISSAYFRKIKPGWKIIAFEPNVLHQKSLERFRKNNRNFEFHLHGLSDESGIKTFYTPTYFGIPLHCETSSNVKPASDFRNYYKFVFKKIKFSACQAPVKTLDELDLQPDVIKIDSEGDDLRILKGAVRTIRRCRPYILLEGQEDSYPELLEFCEQLDLRVYKYDYLKNRLINSRFFPARDDNDQRNLVVIPAEKITNGKLPIQQLVYE